MSKKTFVCLQLLFGLAILGLAFLPLSSSYGQAVNATLSGKVVDSSGASIAKATVTATNTATGFLRSVQASDAGEYTIPRFPRANIRSPQFIAVLGSRLNQSPYKWDKPRN